ncbi:TSUP family transporter, partial [Acinetobacter baumannii]|uniref:TSUP family transporter n=1 Tax=Acinetobacter baumannii TaxID=470 RepID=UPI0013D19007
AGAATGILAGVFGVGGGAVIVPVLYELFGVVGVPLEVRMPLCVGTSLAIIIPTSIRSFQAHRARGAVDLDVLKAWAVP